MVCGKCKNRNIECTLALTASTRTGAPSAASKPVGITERYKLAIVTRGENWKTKISPPILDLDILGNIFPLVSECSKNLASPACPRGGWRSPYIFVEGAPIGCGGLLSQAY